MLREQARRARGGEVEPKRGAAGETATTRCYATRSVAREVHFMTGILREKMHSYGQPVSFNAGGWSHNLVTQSSGSPEVGSRLTLEARMADLVGTKTNCEKRGCAGPQGRQAQASSTLNHHCHQSDCHPVCHLRSAVGYAANCQPTA